MAIQTDYSERMSAPSPGTIAGPDYNTGTGIVETGAGIGFGLAVGQGSGDQGVVLGGAAGIFRGISVRDVTNVNNSSPDVLAQYASMSYIKRGQVWVLAGGAVAAGDAVHYSTTTGVISAAGGATIANARFKTSGASGDRVLVELGMPSAS